MIHTHVALRRGKILAAAFVALTLIQLVPIWSAHYLPTADGPAHLYNAWILRGLLTGKAPAVIASHYAIDWRPHPNWIGHVALALFLTVAPPLVAEKLLFSAIVVLFLSGAWILATAGGERGAVYAFLAFPFVYHQLLQTGFYNFSMSIAVWMIVAGYWWRHRDRPDARTIATNAGLLLLCYFSHPMSTTLAIGEIGLLWLLTLRGRLVWTHARHLVAFIPASLLMLWFVAQHSRQVVLDSRPLRQLAEYLARTQILFTFHYRQLEAGKVLFAILMALAIATLVIERAGHREEDAFLLVYVCFLGLFFWSPSAFAGGGVITERLSLFVALSPLPWYSPRIPRMARIAVVVAMSVFAIANAVYFTVRYRDASKITQEFLSAISPVAPESVLLPLLFDRNAPDSYVGYFQHATAYAAIDKHLVDLDNYEPETGYFPIKYVPGLHIPAIFDIEANPGDVPVSSYARDARFILTWKMPAGHKLIADLSSSYRLVAESPNARIYESKVSFLLFRRPRIILLPLAGTTHDVGTRARWRVDQQLRNAGATPVRVALSTCVTPPCDADIAPGQTLAIASGDPSQLYVFVETERSNAGQLQPSTILRRTDQAGKGFSVSIPSVRESEFRRDALVFRNVPLSPAKRLNLRLWVIKAAGGAAYSVAIFDAGGRQLARRTFATGADGFASDTNLGGQFPDLGRSERSIDVVVKVEDALPAARAWGFITATDNRTDIPVLIIPDTAPR
jgi:hypothetical protein